jgi:hypothetical protein
MDKDTVKLPTDASAKIADMIGVFARFVHQSELIARGSNRNEVRNAITAIEALTLVLSDLNPHV